MDTETITVETKCPECGLVQNVSVPKSDYEAWKDGAPIQDVMPYLIEDDREALQTGICADCWDSSFE